jgi:hypothetical protein
VEQFDLFSRMLPMALESLPDSEEGGWIRDHPSVVREFWEVADRLRMAGKRYGAKGVGEIVRWEIFVKGGEDEDYKLNNNVISLLARIYNRQHPNYFELRKSKFDKEE